MGSEDPWTWHNVIISGDDSWRLEIGTLVYPGTRFRLLSSAGVEHFFQGGVHPTGDDLRDWITTHVGDPYGEAMASRLSQAGGKLGWISAS
jgi:hypothetical protein